MDNGITWEASCIEPILDQLVHGIGVRGGSSVGQRLIQALIDEDKVESITNNTYISEGCPFDTHEIHFDEGGWKSNAHNYKLEPLMNFEASVRAPNGLMMDSDWKYNDGLSHKSSNVIDKAKVWPEFQYSEMCFSDRIIIELSEVGVSIEPVVGFFPSIIIKFLLFVLVILIYFCIVLVAVFIVFYSLICILHS